MFLKDEYGNGEEEESKHRAALVDDLVDKYSSLTDGYSLLNNDISTISKYSICDYSDMLEVYDDEVTPNATDDLTDDTQNTANNNSFNMDTFDRGDYSSSDNDFTFTVNDNHLLCRRWKFSQKPWNALRERK